MNSKVGVYLFLLSFLGIVGRGNLYDEASRSHAPSAIAVIHFEEADSVSPTEMACCSAGEQGAMVELRLQTHLLKLYSPD